MWLVPTYKRPERLAKWLAAAIETGVSTPGLIIMDEDADYPPLVLPNGWEIFRLPHSGMGGSTALQEAFKAYPNEPWYGVINDDMVPKTPNWDTRIIAQGGPLKFVSSNDLGAAPQRMTGAVYLGGDVIRAMGYLVPDGLEHCFADNVWEDVGTTFGIWKVDMDVVLEHENPILGKGEEDESFLRMKERFKRDEAAFIKWRDTERADCMKRVGKALGAISRTFNPKGVSVFVATPAYGGNIHTTYLKSWTGTVASLIRSGIPFQLATIPDESMIQRARNAMVRLFLDESESSHLLFIDADMGWPSDAIIRLLSANVDVIGAAGMRKDGTRSFCYREIPGAGVDPATGLIEVDTLGTGFLLISRKALTEMRDAYRDRAYIHVDDKEYHALFDPGVYGGQYWSEDYVFCRRWRQLGGKVWLDPTIALQHTGQKTWEGAPIEALVTVQAHAA